jgi:hypothetical protein
VLLFENLLCGVGDVFTDGLECCCQHSITEMGLCLSISLIFLLVVCILDVSWAEALGVIDIFAILLYILFIKEKCMDG